MKTPNIQITQADLNKLQQLLHTTQVTSPEDKSNRESLSRELLRAEVKLSVEIPADVITLNSRARLRDLATGDIMELSIVLPEDVDVEAGRISILAPLGTAMLGFRKDDVFDWSTPGGRSSFRVEEILYQPEAVARSGESIHSPAGSAD
jgi:regulator of nucleoside diphosphate kinase